jgi:hypothetical protein
MKKLIFAIAVVTVCVILCCSRTIPEERASFVEIGGPGTNVLSKNDGLIKELGAFEKAWEKIDSDTKQKIELYIVIELGLSSTGKIELIGNYRLTEDDEFGKLEQQVLHFIQRDLFGSRLFWSCLINVDNYNTKLLYHVNIDTTKKPINSLNRD